MKKYPLLLLISWSVLIFIITAIPGNYIPQPLGFINLFSPDKIAHIFIFTPFSYLFLDFLLLRKNAKFKKRKYYIFVLLCGIIYAGFTELLQLFVIVGRSGNIYDFLADLIGVFLGIIVFNRKINLSVR
jgi:VanZ family protein